MMEPTIFILISIILTIVVVIAMGRNIHRIHPRTYSNTKFDTGDILLILIGGTFTFYAWPVLLGMAAMGGILWPVVKGITWLVNSIWMRPSN